MPVPPFTAFFQPILEVIADQQEHRFSDLEVPVGERLGLTPEDRAELLPSGKQRRYAGRLGWAKTYLTKAELIETTRRGFVRLTARGQDALRSRQPITLDYLNRHPNFRKFIQTTNSNPQEPTPTNDTQTEERTPEERLEDTIRSINQRLAAAVLDQLLQKDPAFFERVVVQLLVRMGYGGSIQDAGKAVGKSGDGGIDGIIKQDRLGLDNVYVQAKRYAPNRTVGASEVRNLAGALQVKKARKGILITTASFTRDAHETAEQIGTIVLVDGNQLAQLMVEYDLGVTPETTHVIKKLDQDYFDDLN